MYLRLLLSRRKVCPHMSNAVVNKESQPCNTTWKPHTHIHTHQNSSLLGSESILCCTCQISHPPVMCHYPLSVPTDAKAATACSTVRYTATKGGGGGGAVTLYWVQKQTCSAADCCASHQSPKESDLCGMLPCQPPGLHMLEEGSSLYGEFPPPQQSQPAPPPLSPTPVSSGVVPYGTDNE